MSSPPPPSPPASPTSPPPPKPATTSGLLGAQHNAATAALPAPPQPLTSSAGCTPAHLRQGLQYADAVLGDHARPPLLSPLGRRAVVVYRDAVAQLLSLDAEQRADDAEPVFAAAAQECLACIRDFEESRAWLACLRLSPRGGAAGELTGELLRFQRAGVWARYGGVFSAACGTLGRRGEVDKVAGWEDLDGQYWADSTRLAGERPWYQRLMSGEASDEVFSKCALHLALSSACDRLGFDSNAMLAGISHYAQHNVLLHASIPPLIRDANYHDLALLLRDDYCRVPCLVELGDIIQENVLSGVIETMLDIWFLRDDAPVPDNPQSWTPSPELRRRTRELRGAGLRGEADSNRDITTQIHQAWTQRLRATAELDADETPANRAVPLSQPAAELARASRRTREWERLENVAYGVCSMEAVWVDSWGRLVPLLLGPRVGEPDPGHGQAPEAGAGDRAGAAGVKGVAGEFERACGVLEAEMPGVD